MKVFTNSLHKKTVLLVVFLTLTGLSGCSSMEDIKIEECQYKSHFELTPPISKGDKLEYKLNTGERGLITVAAITPNSIISTSGKEYFLAQMQCINRSKISAVKTTAAGLGITTIIVSSLLVIGAMETASAALSV